MDTPKFEVVPTPTQVEQVVIFRFTVSVTSYLQTTRFLKLRVPKEEPL